ncbi:arsenate reductase (glutaredoxin) [Shewanella sp. NIFS-20-20]|uniref:arsenate reductase (glutaredoxin) n=1 Tax=Shewanella sp. NIFS-20-20 TaxID=2853806 RepID=UPI001C46271C|nr:arsenate reductase (glutaredoxin) [Shewanella sp. NIFS-20-20]MBV7317515.1 arsenate reductase (glutaredoxin) [Shewanella sp. NIFS-20-20]
MDKVVIFHNPRCSKSRETLALIAQHGYQADIFLYLEQPLELAMIDSLLQQLGFDSARQLMRTKEAEYKDHKLADISDEVALRQALITYPKLIERPIVIVNDKAVIGRPPESVLALL